MLHSVIVPARNASAFIEKAVNSLLNQTLALSEIIIVSDSDDDCVEAVLRVMKHHKTIRLFKTSAHVGAYLAQNVGLHYASGDLISFCGADDMWTPTRSAELSAVSDSWRSLANTFHVKIDERGNPISKSSETLGGVFSYSRKMMVELGGFKPWPCSADSDLYHRAVSIGGVRCISKNHSYLYRQHPAQLTRMPDTALSSDRRRAYERLWGRGPTRIEPSITEHNEIKL